jgi:predicted nucleotidyltransferase component of viral defense system
MTTLHEINERLKEFAKDRGLDFNEAKIVLALERLMARLQSDKKLSQHLVFKGGFILLKVFASSRFTRDLDVLASKIEIPELVKNIKKCIHMDLDDHFWFGDEKQEGLVPDDPYGTVRFNIAFQLGPKPEASKVKKLSRVHLDIGFSDVVTPEPRPQELASLVSSLPSISATIYPIETVIAEKLEAFVSRESLNSRAKDILDLVNFLPQNIESKDLSKAIQNTFENRETPLPDSFRVFAKSLDLTSLRSAWPSVKDLSGKKTFEELWKQFLDVLSRLDDK